MIGIMFMIPLYIGSQFFPRHKGIVLGIIVSGYG